MNKQINKRVNISSKISRLKNEQIRILINKIIQLTLIKSLGSYSHWKTRLPPILPDKELLLDADGEEIEEDDRFLSSSTLSFSFLLFT